VALQGKTVVIVDDGIATGSTAAAACQVARAHGAARVVLAVPVAPPDCSEKLGPLVDEFVCLQSPRSFFAVGQFYDDFAQTTDEEVVAALHRQSWTHDEPIELDISGVRLRGDLTVPAGARGLVVFAHGSGSSRRSPRNRAVAQVLGEAGLATLLFDLLTVGEEADRANVFDIPTLAHRLSAVTRKVTDRDDVHDLKVGYFGASTGAAAALWAAAEPDSSIAAVVSRGGRPDLAEPRLAHVKAPTLLIVGGEDRTVLALNLHTQEWMSCSIRLLVVPGATHLFEEPGAMDVVAGAARDWFVRYLAPT
jgi:putative phosphoribosyl transferase